MSSRRRGGNRDRSNPDVMNEQEESDFVIDDDVIPNDLISIETAGDEDFLETFNMIKLCVLSDGKLISEDSDKTAIKIRDLEEDLSQNIKSPHCLQIFEGHQGEITCIEEYNDQLITGSQDGVVKIWDQSTSNCLLTLPHDGPIGSLLIIEDEDRVRLRTSILLSNISYVWDLTTGALLARE